MQCVILGGAIYTAKEFAHEEAEWNRQLLLGTAWVKYMLHF